MNLKNLTDEKLLVDADRLHVEERELLTVILHHLKEIETRRLFSSMGYKSLYDFAMKRWGYSEDQAARRISAMRLLKELPEIEEQMASGGLSLANICQAQSLFRMEQKLANTFSKAQKIEVLKSLENKTKREAEKIVLSLSSEPAVMRPEKIRPLSEDMSEMRFPVRAEVLEKLEVLKGLLAHSNPHISLSELFEKLCDLGIEAWDPGKIKNSALRPAPDRGRRVAELSLPPNDKGKIKDVPFSAKNKTGRKYIPAPIKRKIWQKAQSQCENCGSKHALEIDHILPKALGGSEQFENFRLLCRLCNQRAAIEKLGLKHMRKFIEL